MRTILIILIALYRYGVSPLVGPSCRFHPSCSCYARESIERFGAFRGTWLALRRIAGCHPWNAGGYDPVPQAWHSRFEPTSHG